MNIEFKMKPSIFIVLTLPFGDTLYLNYLLN